LYTKNSSKGKVLLRTKLDDPENKIEQI